MLGSGDGRVATPGDRAAAKVVPPGDGAGGDERDRPGRTHIEHAHKDERVLPQQVGLLYMLILILLAFPAPIFVAKMCSRGSYPLSGIDVTL